MITAEEAKQLMPSNRKDTILEELEELIVSAAEADKTIVQLPKGFFGEGIEMDVLYNAKNPPIFAFVKKELETRGFSLLKNSDKLSFAVSWDKI